MSAATHCKRGHDLLDPANVYAVGDKRYCKTCRRINSQNFRADVVGIEELGEYQRPHEHDNGPLTLARLARLMENNPWDISALTRQTGLGKDILAVLRRELRAMGVTS